MGRGWDRRRPAPARLKSLQRVQFFEDDRGPEGARRLLLGVAIEGHGEAVKLATAGDVRNFPWAYAEYASGSGFVPAGWSPSEPWVWPGGGPFPRSFPQTSRPRPLGRGAARCTRSLGR